MHRPHPDLCPIDIAGQQEQRWWIQVDIFRVLQILRPLIDLH